MNTLTAVDTYALKDAFESRDTDAQLELYADDAQVTIADPETQAGQPRQLNGKEEIRTWLEEINSRELTHTVTQTVSGDEGIAYVESCRYPNGGKVLSATVCETEDGLITKQTSVVTWDQ